MSKITHIPLVTGILLFDKVELLDFAGPLEVFYRAKISSHNTSQEEPAFLAFTFGKNKTAIKVAGGLQVIPDKDFSEIDKLDILLIPGGPGARTLPKTAEEIRFLQKIYKNTALITTVCTGSWLLAQTGLIDNRKVTTHHYRYEAFKEEFPKIELIKNERIVDDGNIISCGGISSGIDLALYIIKKYFGKEIMKMTAAGIEYPYYGFIT